MMKATRILTICMAALLASVAISCQPEEPSIVLEGASSVSAPASGTSQSVKITTNYDWSANASDPWIRISPSSGKKGTTSVSITVDANTSGKSRQGSVTVTCMSLTKSVSVSQEDDTSLTGDGAAIEIPAEGGSKTVTLSANHDWSAKASDTWIKVEPASGSGGSISLKISAEANDTGKAREGSVTVSCNSLNVSYKVSQQPNLSQQLVIKHENPSFTVPNILGSGLLGKVLWGDGTEEAYSSSLKHTYSSSGSHTLTIKFVGGTGFELGAITGITEIDVTEF